MLHGLQHCWILRDFRIDCRKVRVMFRSPASPVRRAGKPHGPRKNLLFDNYYLISSSEVAEIVLFGELVLSMVILCRNIHRYQLYCDDFIDDK